MYCTTCKGTGFVSEPMTPPREGGLPEELMYACPRCDGVGQDPGRDRPVYGTGRPQDAR